MHKNKFHGILSFYSNFYTVMVDLEMVDVTKEMKKSILLCFNKHVSPQLKIGTQKTSGLDDGQHSKSCMCRL